MYPFSYDRPSDAASAVAAVMEYPGAFFLAGGTTLIDLIKETYSAPAFW